MWAILTGVQSKFYVIEFTSFCSHSKFQTVAITSEGLANQNVMDIIRSINRALDNSHVLLLNNYLFYILGRWRVCIYIILYIYIYLSLIIFIYVYIETVDCPLSGWIFLGKKTPHWLTQPLLNGKWIGGNHPKHGATIPTALSTGGISIAM